MNDEVIWRGIDNTRGADGDPVSSLLLVDSDVAETYQENTPSAANPNAISNNSYCEWDWVLQHYLANRRHDLLFQDGLQQRSDVQLVSEFGSFDDYFA